MDPTIEGDHLIDVLSAFIRYDGYSGGKLMAARSAATSGFVSGYAAFFYYRWLSGALPVHLGVTGVVLSNAVDLMLYRPIKYMGVSRLKR